MRNFATLIATQESLELDSVKAPVQSLIETEALSDVNSDLNEQQLGIDNLVYGIETASKAKGSIIELINITESSLENEGDGLSEKESELIQITHESIMNSLGYDFTSIIFSPESFSSAENRRKVTLDTLESLTDKAKSIGQGILKALKAVIEGVIGFIAKLINNRALMERHLNSLEKRINDLPLSSAPKQSHLAAGAGYLTMDSKGDVKTALEIIEAVPQNLDIAKIVTSVLNAKVSDLKSGDFLDVAGDLPDKIKELPKRADESYGIFSAGSSVKLTLPDIKDLAFRKERLEDGDGSKFKLISDFVAVFNIKLVENDGRVEKLESPNRDDLLNLVSKTKVAIKSLRDAEKTRSFLREFLISITKPLADGAMFIAKTVTSGKHEKMAVAFSGIKDAFYKIVKLMTTFINICFSQAFKVIKGAADYIGAGLKNLDTEPANTSS